MEFDKKSSKHQENQELNQKVDISNIQEFKVVVIGDGGVGKTTFIKRHVTGDFETRAIPTMGVEVISTIFYTNYGPIRLNIWDTAGQEKLCPLREGYYIGANAAIIIFDVSSRITFKNVPRWYKDLINIMKADIPIVLLGNKVDLEDRKVKIEQIQWHKQYNIQYYDVSSKSMFQYDKPFLYILQKLLMQPNLHIVDSYAQKPDHMNLDQQYLDKISSELEEVQNQSLPSDEEQNFD